MAVPPMESTRARPASSTCTSLVNGTSTRLLSAKFNTNISSSGFDAREIDRGGFDLRALGTHAAAVVDQQPERNGDIVLVEQHDRLTLAVLQDRERVAGESRHQLTAGVPHRGFDDDEPGFGAKGRASLLEKGEGGGCRREARDHGRSGDAGASCTWIIVSAGKVTS